MTNRPQPKSQRLYVLEFEVRGTGGFPLDMLRFDQCCPISQDDLGRMIDSSGFRYVRLRMFSESKDGPTVRRWASFGWEVMP